MEFRLKQGSFYERRTFLWHETGSVSSAFVSGRTTEEVVFCPFRA